MLKIKYNVNGHWRDYDFLFKSEWAANLKARDLCNIMHTDTVVVEVKTNLVIAHYCSD